MRRLRPRDDVDADPLPDAVPRLRAGTARVPATPPGVGPMTCLNWWDGVLPVLDFEATGTDPQEDRIVSVALVLCTPRGRTLPGGVVTLVNPGVPIPPEASAVHGITDDMVQDKPTAAEL